MPSSDALKGMDKEEKLEFILDSAMKCLFRHGSGATTMDLIAVETGVSKGTLTYYFKNKEDIIIQLASHLAGKLYTEIRLSIKEYNSPKERLIHAINQFWSNYKDNPQLQIGYYDLWAQGFYNDRLRQEVIKIHREFRSIFLDELLLQDPSEHTSNKHSHDAILIAGILEGVMMQWLLEPNLVENWDVVQQRLIEVVTKIMD